MMGGDYMAVRGRAVSEKQGGLHAQRKERGECFRFLVLFCFGLIFCFDVLISI